MKQGKCKPCKTIWVWDKDIPTTQAPHCRDCGGTLVRTCMPILSPGDRPHSVVRRLSDGARLPWGASAAYQGPILAEPKAPLTWYPLQRVGNYFSEESGRIVSCPMNGNGTRGYDDEVCDCDDQVGARTLFLEAKAAAEAQQ